jgi:hypothetical protein
VAAVVVEAAPVRAMTGAERSLGITARRIIFSNGCSARTGVTTIAMMIMMEIEELLRRAGDGETARLRRRRSIL